LSLNRGPEPNNINAEMLEYLEYSDWRWGQSENPNATLTEVVSGEIDLIGVVTSEPYAGNVWEMLGDIHDDTASAVSVDRSVTEALPSPRNINGPYVDIPTGIMFSDSRSYQVHDYTNTASGGRAITIHPDTDLLIFAYHTLFYTPSWIQEGQLHPDPERRAVRASHQHQRRRLQRDGGLFQKPGIRQYRLEFPEPEFWHESSIITDIIKICQFTNVDVSGNPFHGVIAPVTVANATSLTLSDIPFNEGDMVVGIEYGSGGGGYGELRCDVGMQPNLTTGGAYNSIYGWSIRTTVGAVPWGADSITASAMNGYTQDHISMLALVLKVQAEEGWITSPSLVDAGTLTAVETQDGIGTSPQAAERADTLVAVENPGSTAFHTLEGGLGDSVAVVEDQAGLLVNGGFAGEELVVQEGQSASLSANGTGYAWTIARAAQSSRKSADGTRGDTLSIDEVVTAWRGLYLSLADTLTAGEISAAYNAAAGAMAEALAGADESTPMVVCWGFAVDQALVLDMPTTQADVHAAVLEFSAVLDGYSAIRIECYFPEMTVIYGKAAYAAVLEIPTVTAVFNRKRFTAILAVPKVEAVAGGMVAASYISTGYLATKENENGE
jgi:hypothetical protein